MSDKEIIDKLIDLTEGTIDHFDREDALDMLYEVKRLLGKRAESEQEPKTDILGKIRAEIEELKPNNPNFKGYFEQNVALNKVLEVIDKYKAESEDKE